MSVRRRQWISPTGETKEAWIVDYRRPARRPPSQDVREEARRRRPSRHRRGRGPRRHPYRRQSGASPSPRPPNCGLRVCHAARLERTTITAYRQHAALHIVPVLGALKLSQLTVPLVRGFEERLRKDGRSPAMV